MYDGAMEEDIDWDWLEVTLVAASGNAGALTMDRLVRLSKLVASLSAALDSERSLRDPQPPAPRREPKDQGQFVDDLDIDRDAQNLSVPWGFKR